MGTVFEINYKRVYLMLLVLYAQSVAMRTENTYVILLKLSS